MQDQPISLKNRTKHNTKVLGIWTTAWTLSIALSTFGPMFLWSHFEVLSLLAIALNIVLGAGMIWANKKHLQGLDELNQKIQLEAMGITLGVTLVLGLGYSSMANAQLIEQADIAFLVILMGLTYISALLVGRMRFR